MDNKREDRDVARFIAMMKSEISKIPPYLSPKEYRMRAERCKSIAESILQRDRVFEKKKYQLLAQKYDQLAREAEMRKKGIMPVTAVKHSQVGLIVSQPQTEIRVEEARDLPQWAVYSFIFGGFGLAILSFLFGFFDLMPKIGSNNLYLLGGFFLLLAILGLLLPKGRDK